MKKQKILLAIIGLCMIIFSSLCSKIPGWIDLDIDVRLIIYDIISFINICGYILLLLFFIHLYKVNNIKYR